MNFNKFINSDYLKEKPLCGIGTYKDELNLATGACTRRIKKLVLTGEEDGWAKNSTITSGNAFYNASLFTGYKPSTEGVCTHYKTVTSISATEGAYWGVNINIITSFADGIDTALKWNQYLAQQYAAGTPVTIWYVLATPTTETITVPSGLSGTEVGYLNQSGTPTPTNPIYPTANTVEKWFDINHYIMGTSTDTLTTLPTVLYPTGTTATVGLKGNEQHTGTPTPTTPIQPQSCGERTGNLLDESNFALVKVTSTAYRYGTSLGVLPQGTYTFNATKSAGAQSIYLTAKLNDAYSQTTISSVPFSFTADGDSEYIIRTANSTGTTWEAEKYSDMMLNTGSTALPYEPYGIKIPILSNSTTTNVYLGEVQTTRKIKKLVLTGEETSYSAIDASKNIFSIRGVFNQAPELLQVGGFCTHYKYNNAISSLAQNMSNGDFVLNKIVDDYSFTIRDNSFSNDTNFKQYVQQQYAANTPVTIWYVLATPETAVVNEPIRKIGDYADEVANVSIPVTAGTNTIDIDTTLKPSEVSVNYKGWHPVADVHEAENGAWT